MPVYKDYPKTNIFVMDRELWEWAKYRGRTEGLSVSEYVFNLIKEARMNER